ncbi:hypothetical protein, partial [Mesorhizobium marinum]|uniref:hypothetical protein n=1 Tax=Mesorhizobium marinum TaxID=3228790 RepID=UPI0034654788
MNSEYLQDLKLENRHLEEMLKSAAATADEVRLRLAEYLEPRPRRRVEILVAVQWLASLAGLPGRCDRRECGRTGLCHAQDACDPACRELWPDALQDRLDDMIAGIALSAFCRENEQEALHAFACRQLGVTPRQGGAPRREARLRAPQR